MNPGTIWFARSDPTVGCGQAGRRPVLVVSSSDFARNIPDLVIAVPLSSRDRGLRHHISVVGDDTGLDSETWALCEQVRAVSRSRLDRLVGTVDRATLAAVRGVVAIFLDL